MTPDLTSAVELGTLAGHDYLALVQDDSRYADSDGNGPSSDAPRLMSPVLKAVRMRLRTAKPIDGMLPGMSLKWLVVNEPAGRFLFREAILNGTDRNNWSEWKSSGPVWRLDDETSLWEEWPR